MSQLKYQARPMSLIHPIRTYSWIGVLLIAAFLSVLVACSGGDDIAGQPGGKEKQRPPVLVEIWEAELGTVSQRVESVGTLLGNESVTITATVTDQVSSIHFQDGQMTKAGEVLVKLVVAEQIALCEEAEANLTEAMVQLQRLNKLGSDISTGAQIDVAEAKVKSSRARLEAAKAGIEDRLIRAPFDGLLGFRRVSTGALVTPGTVITELDDISRMKLDFAVPETYLARVQVGNEVYGNSPAWPDETFVGEVVSIRSRVDPITRAVTVRAIIDNSDFRLRPGMLMGVQLVAGEREALVVPEQALIQLAGSSMVFLMDAQGKAERRPVTIGKRVHGGVEIIAGLAVGEKVVVNGQFNLRPGATMRLVDSLPGAGG